MSLTLRGTYTALVTPFHEDGSIDEKSLQSSIETQIEHGITGVVPCGTTGEAAAMSVAEQLRVVEIAVATAGGRVPVIAGAGSSDTAVTVSLARQAVAAGADAILTATPSYNKPNDAGLVGHYQAVAQAADGKPVVVYNVPGRTARNMPPELVLRLAEIPGIAGVKEASGDVAQVEELLLKRRPNFAVLSGDDSLTLPLLALGIDGVISVVSNEAPKAFSELVLAGLADDFATARMIHVQLAELMRINFIESNPVPVKTALAELGTIPAAHFRLPLAPMSEGNKTRLVACLRRAGLLPAQS